jgi:hypothetical protein
MVEKQYFNDIFCDMLFEESQHFLLFGQRINDLRGRLAKKKWVGAKEVPDQRKWCSGGHLPDQWHDEGNEDGRLRRRKCLTITPRGT